MPCNSMSDQQLNSSDSGSVILVQSKQSYSCQNKEKVQSAQVYTRVAARPALFGSIHSGVTSITMKISPSMPSVFRYRYWKASGRN